MQLENIWYIYANQADRPAAMLAKTTRNGQELGLFEYSMPAGSTALVVLTICDRCKGTGQVAVGKLQEPDQKMKRCHAHGCWGKGYRKVRNISYSNIPKYWIQAIAEAGNEHLLSWNPQQLWTSNIRAAQERFDRLAAKVRTEQ